MRERRVTGARRGPSRRATPKANGNTNNANNTVTVVNKRIFQQLTMS